MTTIEEKMQEITAPVIARRIKNELQNMKKNGIFCNYDDVAIIKYDKEYYHIILKNLKDNRLYKFIIPLNYPFESPRLELNQRPYSHYVKFKSDKFRELFIKYKGDRCFCCETILCPDNWGPQLTLNRIFDEVDLIYRECREIVDRVIVNVIKRKYSIDDANILEWLY